MKIRLSAKGLELTGELERYTNAKIAHLARRVPRKLRPAAECEVRFVQTRKKGVKINTCSVIFVVDGAELRAEETTLHMYAALDIAVVHLEHQLVDYIAKQHKRRLRIRLKGFFRKRP